MENRSDGEEEASMKEAVAVAADPSIVEAAIFSHRKKKSSTHKSFLSHRVSHSQNNISVRENPKNEARRERRLFMKRAA